MELGRRMRLLPTPPLLEINHIMSVHDVCQVESSMARVFELAFVFIVWVKSVVWAVYVHLG